MSDVVIAARGLGKEYVRDQFHIAALKDVDLDIHKGEFVALMGSSASGKSTLLHLIAAIDRPTSGEIRVLREDQHKLSGPQLAAWRHSPRNLEAKTKKVIEVIQFGIPNLLKVLLEVPVVSAALTALCLELLTLAATQDRRAFRGLVRESAALVG